MQQDQNMCLSKELVASTASIAYVWLKRNFLPHLFFSGGKLADRLNVLALPSSSEGGEVH
jgi:hypothetical protein